MDQQLLSFHLTADFIALTWNGEKTRKEISNICQLSIPNRPIIAKVGKEDWKMEKTDDKKTIWQNMQEVFGGNLHLVFPSEAGTDSLQMTLVKS